MQFKSEKKLLVTGASGNLGTAIRSLVRCAGIDRNDLDITDAKAVKTYFAHHRFDILIHCAAYTDVAGAEKDHASCYRINVTGTENLVRSFSGDKFVYISTDYVFDGQRGNYSEDDVPNPVNYYALTKLLGEIATRQYPNTLVIRTCFKPDGPWKYPKAFIDQFTSHDYVSERAPDIVRASLTQGLFGLIHIAGTRKSVYELARKNSPQVGKMSLADVPVTLPRDTSLNSSRWNDLKKSIR